MKAPDTITSEEATQYEKEYYFTNGDSFLTVAEVWRQLGCYPKIVDPPEPEKPKEQQEKRCSDNNIITSEDIDFLHHRISSFRESWLADLRARHGSDWITPNGFGGHRHWCRPAPTNHCNNISWRYSDRVRNARYCGCSECQTLSFIHDR